MGAVDIVDIEVDIYIDNIDRTGESTRETTLCTASPGVSPGVRPQLTPPPRVTNILRLIVFYLIIRWKLTFTRGHHDERASIPANN
jgi:hypothetical protein